MSRRFAGVSFTTRNSFSLRGTMNEPVAASRARIAPLKPTSSRLSRCSGPEAKKQMAFNSLKTHVITENLLTQLNKAIQDLEFEIASIIMSKDDLRANYKLITSVRGIGQVTACDLIIKTGNFKEIDNARKAASYAGICPFPNSSGKMVKKSRVSSMADKELKTLLYLCSVVAVNRNPEYKLYFQRKRQEGKPYFLAMNNIANKLIRTIYSIVNSRKAYELAHITSDPREIKKVA
jgi:hypothetical protein